MCIYICIYTYIYRDIYTHIYTGTHTHKVRNLKIPEQVLSDLGLRTKYTSRIIVLTGTYISYTCLKQQMSKVFFVIEFLHT